MPPVPHLDAGRGCAPLLARLPGCRSPAAATAGVALIRATVCETVGPECPRRSAMRARRGVMPSSSRLEDRAEVHLRGVDEVGHTGKPNGTAARHLLRRPPTAPQVVLGQPSREPCAPDQCQGADGHAGGRDGRHGSHARDHDRGPVRAHEGEQPPHTEEGCPPDRRRSIRPGVMTMPDDPVTPTPTLVRPRPLPRAWPSGAARTGPHRGAAQPARPPTPVRTGPVALPAGQNNSTSTERPQRTRRGLRGIQTDALGPQRHDDHQLRRAPGRSRAPPSPTVSSTRRCSATTQSLSTRARPPCARSPRAP